MGVVVGVRVGVFVGVSVGVFVGVVVGVMVGVAVGPLGVALNAAIWARQSALVAHVKVVQLEVAVLQGLTESALLKRSALAK